jgi:hypothetical protein
MRDQAEGNGTTALTRLVNAKKARLIALGYPRPEHLDDKGPVWLDSEIAAMTAKSPAYFKRD